MMIAAALAGALLLLGPALLKSRLGVDEVVTTLLLNFIVLLFVSMMLDGADEGPDGDGLAAERGAAGRPAAATSWSSARACTPGCCGRWRWPSLLWALMKYAHAAASRSAPSAPMRAPRPSPACRWAG